MDPLASVNNYRGHLASFVWLAPEYEQPVKRVAPLVDLLEVYQCLYEGRSYAMLWRRIRVDDDYGARAVSAARFVSKQGLKAWATPEYKRFLHTLWAICRECLEKAYMLYTRAQNASTLPDTTVPAKPKFALRQYGLALEAIWPFQRVFHMEQARRYGLDNLKLLPSPKTSPMDLDSPPLAPPVTSAPPQ